jgi:outer membrane murein-binding lipoprotein Lpp
MTRQHPIPSTDDHGWLITPRALTSLATVVGLVYTLHAPVRYVMQIGSTVDALKTRVANLETEIDQQRGTIAAAELVLVDRDRRRAADAAVEAPSSNLVGDRRTDPARQPHRR